MAAGFFDEFIDPFLPGPFVLRAEHYMRYVFARGIISETLRNPPVIYDIGCGNGYGRRIFAANRTNPIWIGFDTSSELLNEAYDRYPSDRWLPVDLKKDSLLKLFSEKKLPRPDAIIAFEILEHLTSPEKVLSELNSLLPKNGLCILSVPNEKYEPKKKGKPRNKYHKQLFSEEGLRDLITRSGFHDLTSYGQPRANAFYHQPTVIVKSIDFLIHVLPFSFPWFARFIAAVLPDRMENSYSMIFVCRK